MSRANLRRRVPRPIEQSGEGARRELLLRDERQRPDLSGQRLVLSVVDDADQHDPERGLGVEQPPRHLETAHPGQVHVENGHIRAQAGAGGERVFPAARLAYDGQAG